MHDLDRTQTEWESEAYAPAAPVGNEIYGETVGESFEAGLLGQEMPSFESQEFAGEMPLELATESPIGEALEIQLASELLEVTNEQELDYFLGGILKRVIPKGIRNNIGRAVGNVLKKVAKTALPVLGGLALGPIGVKAASLAGQVFGLETEGLTNEDRDFEVARHFVRFAADTAQRANSARTANPQQAARAAAIAAARRYAPGLLRSALSAGAAVLCPAAQPNAVTNANLASSAGRGTWVRRGANIVLYGV